MSDIKASVITIGGEILFGHTLDTNSHFISGVLTDIGIQVVLKASVEDRRESIVEILDYAESKSDLILMTGGLGPTNDDITKKCLSEYFDSPLVLDLEVLRHIESYFKKRGFSLTDKNRKQAEIPDMASVIFNEMGTAPGMWIEKDNKVFISMPGVPHEMQHIVNQEVIPRIRKKFKGSIILHKLIMTAGIGESWLSDMISDWENNLPAHISLAYLPGYGQVKLRLTASGKDKKLLEKDLSKYSLSLKKIISKYIYGENGIELEERIGQILRERGQSLSIAESCTGGHLSHLITSIPGSSEYFKGGIIAYNNSVKEKFLGVSTETLKENGAVSEATVREMAEGIRKKYKTDYAVSTSGIAGPGGGSPGKPVGTVWIAVSDRDGTITRKYNIPKDRLNNIKYSSVAALVMLWQRISQKNGSEK